MAALIPALLVVVIAHAIRQPIRKALIEKGIVDIAYAAQEDGTSAIRPGSTAWEWVFLCEIASDRHQVGGTTAETIATASASSST